MAAIRGLGCDFGASVYLRQAFQWYCTPQGTSRISWIFNWRSVSFSPLLSSVQHTHGTNLRWPLGVPPATAVPRFHASTSVALGCHFHVSTAHCRVASVASTMVSLGVEFSKDPVSIRGFEVVAWIFSIGTLGNHQLGLFYYQYMEEPTATSFPHFHVFTSVAFGCHFHVSTLHQEVASASTFRIGIWHLRPHFHVSTRPPV